MGWIVGMTHRTGVRPGEVVRRVSWGSRLSCDGGKESTSCVILKDGVRFEFKQLRSGERRVPRKDLRLRY
jgi:hypothetical protein